MAVTRADTSADTLASYLLRTANAKGGWPYYAGKASRIEPTCWALLALRGAWRQTPAEWNTFANPHTQFVLSRQRADGTLSDLDGGPTNLAWDGLAARTLALLAAEASAAIERAKAAIVGVKGVSIDSTDGSQNNRLQAWPWYPDTFSWAEPTSWCLLALKTAPRSTQAIGRVAEAERLMDNRSCDDGGWNYGSARSLGQGTRPHVPTTALGLLALQDRRDLPSVPRALEFLTREKLKERSGSALGLTAIALHIYGREYSDVIDQLADISDQTERLGNVHAMAVALAGLSVGRHQGEYFRVS